MLAIVGLLTASLSLATPLHQSHFGATHRETEDEAVLSAARLAKHVTTGTMASIFPSGSMDTGHPFALMESHAPCHSNGALTFITFPISQMTRNIQADPAHRTSYALQTPLKNGASEYSLPRVSFIGNLTILKDVDENEHDRLTKCYTSVHPDAKWWLPGDSHGAHVSHWARLDIGDIYYIGGFGTTGWIGHIPLDKYQDAMEQLVD